MQHLPSQPLIPVQSVTLVMVLDIDLDAPSVDIELGADGPMAAGADTRLFDTGTLAGRARTVPGWRTQPAVHYRAD